MGHSLSDPSRSAIVEACISAYAQTIASLPGAHWRANDRSGRDRITTSALARVLRSPNSHMTRSDFLLNLTRDLYSTGNAYALAPRSYRFEIDELHPMNPRASTPVVAEDGSIFYRLSGNDVIDQQLAEQPIISARRFAYSLA